VHSQQHHHRRARQDSVLQLGRHVHEAAGLHFPDIGAQGELRLAPDDVNRRGHGGRVCGKLLAGSEAENHYLQAVVVVERAAEDAVFGDLDLGVQVGVESVVFVHGCYP